MEPICDKCLATQGGPVRMNPIPMGFFDYGSDRPAMANDVFSCPQCDRCYQPDRAYFNLTPYGAQIDRRRIDCRSEVHDKIVPALCIVAVRNQEIGVALFGETNS